MKWSKYCVARAYSALTAERNVSEAKVLAAAVKQYAVEENGVTCPRCRRVSFNENDIREHYCGACHLFHGGA